MKKQPFVQTICHKVVNSFGCIFFRFYTIAITPWIYRGKMRPTKNDVLKSGLTSMKYFFFVFVRRSRRLTLPISFPPQ